MKWEYMYVRFSFNDKFNKVLEDGKKCYSIIFNSEYAHKRQNMHGICIIINPPIPTNGLNTLSAIVLLLPMKPLSELKSIIGSIDFLIEKLDGFGAMGWESLGSPCIISEKDMLFKRPI